MKPRRGALVLFATIAFVGSSSFARAVDVPPPLKEQYTRVIQTVAAYLLASAEKEGAIKPEFVVKALESNTTFFRYHLESLAGAKTLKPRYESAYEFAKHVSARTKENSSSIRDVLALLMKTQMQTGGPRIDFCFAMMDTVAERTGIADLAPPKTDQLWSFETATHEPHPDEVRYASFRLCSALAAVAEAVDQFVEAHGCDIVSFADEAEPDFVAYKKGS